MLGIFCTDFLITDSKITERNFSDECLVMFVLRSADLILRKNLEIHFISFQ